MKVLRILQVWLLAVSSIFWSTASSGYFVLINDYIVKNTNLNELEAALGITIAGKLIYSVTR